MTYSFKFKKPGALSVKMTNTISMAFIALTAAVFCAANANARATTDEKPAQLSTEKAEQHKDIADN